MKLLFNFILLICLFLVGALPAQSNVDSIKKELAHQTENAATLKVLIVLCESFIDQKLLDSVPPYLEQAKFISSKINDETFAAKIMRIEGRINTLSNNIQLAVEQLRGAVRRFEAIGDKSETALAWFNLAQAYDYNDEQYKAIEAYEMAIKYFSQIDKGKKDQSDYRKKMIGAAKWRIGTNYEDDGDYSAALGQYQAALDLFKELKNDLLTGNVLINFGNNYLSLNEPRKALAYYQDAMTIFERLEMDEGIGVLCINLGEAYNMLEMKDSSLYFLRKGEAIFRNNNNEYHLSEVLVCESSRLMEKGDLDVALLKLHECQSITQRIVYRHLDANIYNQIGEIYRQKGDFQKAEVYLDSARTSIQDLNLKPLLRDNALSSSLLYEEWAKSLSGKEQASLMEKALQYFKQHKTYQDSIFNEDKHKQLTQKEMTYQFEKKEALAQNEIKKQRLFRNGFMGGFAIVVFFSMAVMRQRNKVKKEKKRSDELLLNILPAEVAEELKVKGSADAKLIDEVTVLFSDFKDFTQLSETQTPKELVAEINECFSAFDMIMQKHGVEKIKTVGDAYLAAGGLPTPNETHAINALNAALEMQEFIKERKRQREKSGGFFFEARIGVHTGPVVAGIVGIKKFAYDIWGDTVNTAERMESSGEAGKINISNSTYRLVKNHFNCSYRGKIDTKGKGEVDMYFVESVL